ncbi:hypothetical protein KKE26_11545 [bacterium]|nr:hypothetical protein [bacterium]MBU1753928.1 hypothetical protein [bacterium]
MKKIVLIAILVLTTFPFQANASMSDATLEFQGVFVNQTTHNQLNGNTLLNQSNLGTLPEWENKLYNDSSINLTYKEWLKLMLKTRPTWTINNEERGSFRNFVDDAYMDIKIRDTSFLTIGRENLQEGVGLIYNPTNFLSEGKAVDYSQREEERKKNREGNYLLRFESIKEKQTFSFLIAPKIGNLQEEYPRQQLRLYSLMGDTDASLSYFHGKQEKLGLNLSGVVGNNIELHTEIALGKGSDRRFLRKKSEIGPPDSGIYEYETYDPLDKEKTFLRALMGGHYTWTNKTNLIIEYFFNQDGYSQSEWNEFIEMVKDADSKLKNPPIGFTEGIFKENLRLANSLMTYRSLRKNYFFFRLSNPEIFDCYDSQLSVLLDVDDKSCVVMPSVDYNGVKNIVIRFGINWFSGDSQSEFGLVPQNTELQLEARYFF